MKREGSLIREIRRAVRDGRLQEPFRAGDIIPAGIAAHRVRRARSCPSIELAIRVATASYLSALLPGGTD